MKHPIRKNHEFQFSIDQILKYEIEKKNSIIKKMIKKNSLKRKIN
jgi:hypothetical protein